MYAIRRDIHEYVRGVDEFINCATENMRQSIAWIILCPCRDYQNIHRFQDNEEIRNHLIRRGFKERYTQWAWHGECNDEESTNVTTSMEYLNEETELPDELVD
jgi:Transposase-associated domain